MTVVALRPRGSWAVIDGMVTVRTPDGTKSAQISGIPPEYLARVLMRELAAEAEDVG